MKTKGDCMIEIFLAKPSLLFIFSSPQEWILVIAAVSLLFGANKLPELAKSLGQTRKAFKEGMREAEEDEAKENIADFTGFGTGCYRNRR